MHAGAVGRFPVRRAQPTNREQREMWHDRPGTAKNLEKPHNLFESDFEWIEHDTHLGVLRVARRRTHCPRLHASLVCCHQDVEVLHIVHTSDLVAHLIKGRALLLIHLSSHVRMLHVHCGATNSHELKSVFPRDFAADEVCFDHLIAPPLARPEKFRITLRGRMRTEQPCPQIVAVEDVFDVYPASVVTHPNANVAATGVVLPDAVAEERVERSNDAVGPIDLLVGKIPRSKDLR